MAIVSALTELHLSEDDHKRIDAEYENWKAHEGYQDEIKSVDLRIAGAESRLDRLTDLLIDGMLEQLTHDQKREALLFEIAKLKEERAELGKIAASERDREKFLELMKTLAPLYRSSKAAEKRVLVENCFSNRIWDGKNVCLEPSELVLAAQNSSCVPYGGPIADTLRTFIQKLDSLLYRSI